MGRETNKQRREKQASTAREKAAAARAAQARVDQRRRAKTILSSVVAIAVVIAVIAVIAITRPGKQTPEGDRQPAAASLVEGGTGVAPATYNQVGQGSASLDAAKAINDAPLTKDGKPELLFIGGEFCPYCAAERWSMVQALSRFGTFDGLNRIRSSSTDTFPNTATFSFYKTSYTSKYLSFVGVENRDRANDQTDLEPVTDAQKKIWSKYTQLSFPFLYLDGKYVLTNTGFSPGDLAGLTWDQIIADLKDPTSSVAKDILGEANVLTAMIGKTTNGQPGDVCSAEGVTKIKLPTASA